MGTLCRFAGSDTAQTMKLHDYLKPELTWVLDSVDSRDALLRELCDRIGDLETNVPAEKLLAALIDREAQGSTATPEGVALPHAMIETADRSFVAAALVRHGVSFGDRSAPRVDLVFVLVGPKDGAWEHLRVLARLARLCHTTGALQHLRSAADAEDLYRRLLEEDARHV